ncbi:MAG: transposase [Gemmata sp.]
MVPAEAAEGGPLRAPAGAASQRSGELRTIRQGLDAVPFERTLTSDDLLPYLRAWLPTACVPLVYGLDNAGIHTSYVVKTARPGLTRHCIWLYYLPPYRPEWNRIDPVFKQFKHHEMPTRSFTTKAELRKAVEDGFDAYRRRLRAKGDKQLRLAA